MENLDPLALMFEDVIIPRAVMEDFLEMSMISIPRLMSRLKKDEKLEEFLPTLKNKGGFTGLSKVFRIFSNEVEAAKIAPTAENAALLLPGK